MHNHTTGAVTPRPASAASVFPDATAAAVMARLAMTQGWSVGVHGDGEGHLDVAGLSSGEALARALLAAGGAVQLVVWVCGSEELVELVVMELVQLVVLLI